MQNEAKAARKTNTSLRHRLMACVVSALLVLSCTGIAYAYGEASDAVATTEEEAAADTSTEESSGGEEATDTEEAEETSTSDITDDKASSDVSLALPTLSSAISPLAIGTLSYIDENGEAQTYSGSYDTVTSRTTTWGSSGTTTWYIVTGRVTFSANAGRIYAVGDVRLILADGAYLYAYRGIAVPEGSSLTIYAQSAGTGYLYASAGTINAAGIGGTYVTNPTNLQTPNSGTITINGGIVEAQGGNSAAGIGGGYGGSGTVIINGGTVTATAGQYGAGIGGGPRGAGTVTINGGTVTATGGSNAAGIGGGGGSYASSTGTVTITGGMITATCSGSQAIGSGSFSTQVSTSINYTGYSGFAYRTSSSGAFTYANNTNAFTVTTSYIQIYPVTSYSMSVNESIYVDESITLADYFTSNYSYTFSSYAVNSISNSCVSLTSGTTVKGISAGTVTVVVTAFSSSSLVAVVGTFYITVNAASAFYSENITIYQGGGVNLGDYIAASDYGSYNFTSYTTTITSTSGSSYVSLSGTNDLQVTGISVTPSGTTATVQVVASSSTVELTATFYITVDEAETTTFDDIIYVNVGETESVILTGSSYFGATTYSDYAFDNYSVTTHPTDTIATASIDDTDDTTLSVNGVSAGTTSVVVTATSSTSGKAVAGTFNIVVEATTFTLTIYKYTGADEENGTPLEDAQFSVEKVTVTSAGEESETVATDPVSLTSDTTNENGEIIISGLELDTIYKISETKVPSGYVLADPVYIKVVNEDGTLTGYLIDPTTWQQKTDTETMSCDYTTKTNPSQTTFAVKIQNTQLESMPQTGFSGALLVFAAGGAIVAAGLYVLCGKRSKFSRAAHAPRL